MKFRVIAAAGAAFFWAGAAAAHDCTLDGTAPEMPDGATLTEDGKNGVVDQIRSFQGALGEYRACLETSIDDPELPPEERQAALDDYNASVEAETAMVEAYQEMMAAYQGG